MNWFPLNVFVNDEWRITLGREMILPEMFLVQLVRNKTVKNVVMRRDSPRICAFDPQKHLLQKPRTVQILQSDNHCAMYDYGMIEFDMDSEGMTDKFFWYYKKMLIGNKPKLQLLVESLVPKSIDNLYCLILNFDGHEIVKVELHM
jgi:hypothetical protein